jgi:hypothetical protein
MADLQRRFREKTLPIWKRLEIQPLGFWDPVIGNYNEFHYILSWNDLAERQRKWDIFQADPEWLAVRAETEGRGPLVASIHNKIWAPADFSDLK